MAHVHYSSSVALALKWQATRITKQQLEH